MIKYLIFITATSSLSFAQDCLDFPDAKNFTCKNTPPSGETLMIEVDFPEGSGCNQPPETGSIVVNGEETIVNKPSASFDDQDGASISFSHPGLGSKLFTVYCTNVEHL